MHQVLATITNSRYGFGGVSVWLERITGSLPARGWQVTTFTQALDSAHLADWKGQHPGIALRPLFGKFARLNEIEPAFNRYLDEVAPDLILVNSSHWMLPSIQKRKQMHHQLRVVGVAHADEEGYYSWLRYYRDCFDHVIGISDTCYHKLLALGFPPERTSTLPVGVPTPPSAPVRPAPPPLRLAYVGRLSAGQKRILDLVPLVKGLYERHIDFSLDLFGTGQDEHELRRQVAAIDVEGRVHLRGWVPSSQIAEAAWSKAHILLLMSEYEGLSASMLEGMAYGVVPIVTRVESGVDQVIKQGINGYTFPIGNTAECAERISELDNDGSRLASMSDAARATIAANYSLDRHSDRLAALFDRVLAAPAQMTPAHYMGPTSRPAARLIPGFAIVLGRRLLHRGNPINEGYTSYP